MATILSNRDSALAIVIAAPVKNVGVDELD